MFTEEQFWLIKDDILDGLYVELGTVFELVLHDILEKKKKKKHDITPIK